MQNKTFARSKTLCSTPGGEIQLDDFQPERGVPEMQQSAVDWGHLCLALSLPLQRIAKLPW